MFSENVLAKEMKITWMLMNKPVHLGLSILEIGKIVMYQFWYDYVKPEIRRESEIMLHGQKNLYSQHVKIIYLLGHFKRC